MLKELKAFLFRGNVLDLAVAREFDSLNDTKVL